MKNNREMNGASFYFPININGNHWVLGTLTLGEEGEGSFRLRDPMGTNESTYSAASNTRRAACFLTR